MTMKFAQLIVGAFALGAALLALYASTFKVRDSIDQMIGDIAEQGRWVMFASVANVIATAALVVVLVLELMQRK
jgi:uncharacterized membrane protein